MRTGALIVLLTVTACRSPEGHRTRTDRAAAGIIAQKQREAFGAGEPFSIERPSDTLRRRLLVDQDLPHTGPASLGAEELSRPARWPEEGYPRPKAGAASGVPPWAGPEALTLTLVAALEVGARNSREYQTTKEGVFLAALDLELERDRFRNVFFATVDGDVTADRTSDGAPDGVTGGADVGVTRLLRNGIVIAGSLGIDLVRLLSGGSASSLGVFGDASITVPLLRGAGRHVVMEPLTQAERDVVYALRQFDRFKRTYAVQVASEYLDVLRLLDGVENARENYRNLVVLSRWAAAQEDAGRISGVQVDQARQDELRARDRWIAATQAYEARLDQFKATLGLPADARIALAGEELGGMTGGLRETLGLDEPGAGAAPDEDAGVPADAPVELVPPTTEGGGPFELDERSLIRLALLRRQDLRVARDRVEDAQRNVIVAADALRAGLSLTGSVSAGETRGLSGATLENGRLRPERGIYSAGLLLDLPFERTAEAIAYRESYIVLEQAVRAVQELEDRVKGAVRDHLRTFVATREGVRIQARAVQLARTRVESTNLVLQAGRGEVRDVLEATEALISAQNGLTAALVDYRVTELELERDLGVLAVDAQGLWVEYDPARIEEDLADDIP